MAFSCAFGVSLPHARDARDHKGAVANTLSIPSAPGVSPYMSRCVRLIVGFRACILTRRLREGSLRQAKRQEPQQASEPPHHPVVPCCRMGPCIPSTETKRACKSHAPCRSYDDDNHLQQNQKSHAISPCSQKSTRDLTVPLSLFFLRIIFTSQRMT